MISLETLFTYTDLPLLLQQMAGIQVTSPSAGPTYTPWRLYGFGNIALLKKVADDRRDWRAFKNF
jgi:hypothetical protein